MIISNKNVYLKSIITFILAIIFSCSMHIVLIIFLICHLYFYFDKTVFYLNKNDEIMINMLLPCDAIVLDKKLEKKCVSEKFQTSKIKNSLKSTLPKKKQILNNSKNESNITNRDFRIGEKNNIHKNNNDFVLQSIKNVDSDNMIDTNCQFSIVKRIYPEYPNQAKVLGIEGKVIVMYNIDNEGKVKKIRILSATPSGVFEKNIKLAMRRWIYKTNIPRLDVIITFEFSLNTIQVK